MSSPRGLNPSAIARPVECSGRLGSVCTSFGSVSPLVVRRSSSLHPFIYPFSLPPFIYLSSLLPFVHLCALHTSLPPLLSPSIHPSILPKSTRTLPRGLSPPLHMAAYRHAVGIVFEVGLSHNDTASRERVDKLSRAKLQAGEGRRECAEAGWPAVALMVATGEHASKLRGTEARC